MPNSSIEAPAIDASDALRLTECALAVVQQRYPHKLDHLILHAQDQPLPQQIHPVFSGCYDWHSSVHMHWSLLRLSRVVPPPLAAAIAAHFDAHFTPDKVAQERAYAAQPERAGFERPYGWAWLLKLQDELDAHAASGLPGASAWAQALRPLSRELATRFAAFLGDSHYPVRAGTHANSAFAMLLALDHARAQSDLPLQRSIERAAQAWFGADRDYPVAYEPGGTDFLSPGLCEALLMREVLGAGFAAWWSGFAPAALAGWLEPAVVSRRRDAQLVHLDGLNLSRAWCLAALATSVPEPQASALRDAARRHRAAAWPHVTGGDFAATHWLVSFALLAALEEKGFLPPVLSRPSDGMPP
ncbi:DUF2891 domain-containing protein [Piscinibacter sp.]|uniref:DUF2891 domain-containing protein n=1 Tax=Piscinibacter sp. TaxID=1903157 RepID=UPI002F407BDC